MMKGLVLRSPVGSMLFSSTTRPLASLRLFSSTSSKIDWTKYPRDNVTNVPPRLENEWFGRNLLRQVDHPLWRAKQRIANYLGPSVAQYDGLEPVVTLHENFDSLLIPADHVSRSPNDTYFVNAGHVLRTHTTAHQRNLLLKGPPTWVVFGDVFRRDAIDASHFPVFHQMDGGRVFGAGTTEAEAERDLKGLLEGLTRHLFGAEAELRWREDYFPFTLPSWELDVKVGDVALSLFFLLLSVFLSQFNGEWMELLGSGLIHPEIMRQCGLGQQVGWAFGMGLERLAMVLYRINDIRAFWSRDDRFARQFRGLPLEAPIAYREYSRFPKTSRDVSFWLGADDKSFHDHQFFELVREVGPSHRFCFLFFSLTRYQVCGEWVECVEKIDSFKHPKTGRVSCAFRIDYRSMEKTLDNAEVNEIQEKLRQQTADKLKVTLR